MNRGCGKQLLKAWRITNQGPEPGSVSACVLLLEARRCFSPHSVDFPHILIIQWSAAVNSTAALWPHQSLRFFSVPSTVRILKQEKMEET